MLTTTTELVDRPERLEFWESWNRRALVGLHCSSPVPDAFRASSTQLSVDGTTVTRIQASPHAVDRNQQSIAATPKHSVFVSVLAAGTGFVFHAGGLRSVRAGDVLMYSTMQPYLLGFGQDMDLLIVDVDLVTVCDEWGVDPRSTAPRVVPASATTSAFASALLSRFTAAPPTDAAPGGGDERDVSGHDRGVSGEMLRRACRGFLAGRTPADELYDRACERIAATACDPDVTASSLAVSLHVSERHLRRVFAEHGDRPSTRLLDERLGRAFGLVLDSPALTIADVATRTGFGSPSSFTRAFGARYGRSPSDVRGAARLTSPGS